MMNLLLLSFCIALGLNLIMFVPAFVYKTDKLTDLSYAISFAAVATSCFLLSSRSLLHQIVLAVILLWALRLGVFLFIRIRKIKHDKRFDDMRENFTKFLRFWVLQGVSVYIILIPFIVLCTKTDPSVGWLSLTGVGSALLGLLLETVADSQKYHFMQQKTGKWIEDGVWRLSRHPNYLGEVIMWIGVYIACVSAIYGNERLLTAISPTYITGLLLFVSGIPILERSSDERWGKEKKYQEYKQKVPVIIPSLKSIKRWIVG